MKNIASIYDAPIKSAAQQEAKYWKLFLLAAPNSRQESAYKGLWRKWHRQLQALEEAQRQASGQ